MNGSKISLPVILNFIDRGLNIANKAIPLYYKAKPMLNNTKNVLKIVSALNSNDSDNTSNDKEEKTNVTNVNNPVFFQ
jgi:hypothetical protein